MNDEAPNGQQHVKEVWQITDRENAKSIWTRIGIGFVNRDDSLNLFLDCIPLSGRIHVRDMRANGTQRKEQ